MAVHAGFVYFADYTAGTLERIGVDGTGRSVVLSGLSQPRAIAVYAPEGQPAVCRGDLNCDARVSFADINPFVLALTDFAAWQHTFGSLSGPGCPDANADANHDGAVNFSDINPFVAMLTSGQTCPNP